MGFFNKLKGIFDRVDDVKRVTDKVTDSAQQTSASNNEPVCVPYSEPVRATAPFNVYNRDTCYFDGIVTEGNFPGYSIQKNVRPDIFDAGAHPSCYPISYLISDGSKQVLAVLVIGKNQYRSMIAKGTYEVLENNNIPYIRFFREMENEKGYVINRIRENLR